MLKKINNKFKKKDLILYGTLRRLSLSLLK